MVRCCHILRNIPDAGQQVRCYKMVLMSRTIIGRKDWERVVGEWSSVYFRIFLSLSLLYGPTVQHTCHVIDNHNHTSAPFASVHDMYVYMYYLNWSLQLCITFTTTGSGQYSFFLHSHDQNPSSETPTPFPCTFRSLLDCN